jgi:hypothetical protein
VISLIPLSPRERGWGEGRGCRHSGEKPESRV